MNKFVCVLAAATVFGLVSLALAENDYLIKVTQPDSATKQFLQETKLRVYARTPEFCLVQVSSEELDYLKQQQIDFKILDDEAEFSLYYFVYCRPDRPIEEFVDIIRQKAIVLEVVKDRVLVKGNPKRIEELTSLGLSLRLIRKHPLPLAGVKPKTLPLTAGVVVYPPEIDSIIQRVTTAELTGYVSDLSGENGVIIGGSPDSLFTRYTYTNGCDQAALYLKEKLESFGLNAWYDTFTIFPSYYFMDIVSTQGGDTAWTGGLFSGIWKTTDAGAYWYQIAGTDFYDLWALCVPHPETLFGAGNGGLIIKSTDAGESWFPLSSPTSAHLRGAFFESPSTGWVTGYSGSIFFTTDGGQTWTDQSTGSANLYEIVFVDANNGWVTGQSGTILHTTNQGNVWTTQTSGAGGIIFGVDFATSSKGWVCGQSGYLAYTTNAGSNWNTQTSGTGNSLYMVSAADSQKVWAAGLGSTILHTTNAGTNWSMQSSNPNSGNFYEVYFVNALKGWVTGYNDLLYTTDGGSNWQNQSGFLPITTKFNVVAELPGLTQAGKQCLITAHYDNTSNDPFNYAPGADDNASGTAAILTAANILKDYDFNKTIRFIGFAGEEQGLIGSDAYAQKADQRGDTILGVYNLDMLGWEGDNVNIVELHAGTAPSSGALADITTAVISNYSLALTSQKLTSTATDRSDHASFWFYGYPAILAIEDFDDFNPYYHTVADLLSAFDLPYYTDLAKASIASLAVLADPITSCTAKPGDANSSGTYTLGDAIAIVNYVFSKPGCLPLPTCWLSGLLCRGDWDGSGTVTLEDAIRAVNYIFNKPGGPWNALPVGVCCLPL